MSILLATFVRRPYTYRMWAIDDRDVCGRTGARGRVVVAKLWPQRTKPLVRECTVKGEVLGTKLVVACLTRV